MELDYFLAQTSRIEVSTDCTFERIKVEADGVYLQFCDTNYYSGYADKASTLSCLTKACDYDVLQVNAVEIR